MTEIHLVEEEFDQRDLLPYKTIKFLWKPLVNDIPKHTTIIHIQNQD